MSPSGSPSFLVEDEKKQKKKKVEMTVPVVQIMGPEVEPPEVKEEEAPVALPRRASLRDRLSKGHFWSGIRERLTQVAQVERPAVDLGKMVNRMGVGAAFGAKTLLKKEARTASVQTVGPTKLLVVSRNDYVGLIGSIQEACANEAAEFLCRHLLMVEIRAGSNRALDNLHPALWPRLARTSKTMSLKTLDRGSVLITAGTENSGQICILRKGALAFCYPDASASRPVVRSRAGATKSSQVVGTLGELVGAYGPILGWPEPATVRVESSTCEIYCVAWTELQRVLTNRVLTNIKQKLLSSHELRSARARGASEVLGQAALEHLGGAASKEQQEAKDALQNAFSAAFSPVEVTERQAFDASVAQALKRLELAMEKADLNEALGTQRMKTPVIPSQPPPITSAAHVRARFYHVLKQDPQLLGVEKLFTEAALDPEKGQLNQWIKKYAGRDQLRRHAELQSLQLILWKQLKHPSQLC